MTTVHASACIAVCFLPVLQKVVTWFKDRKFWWMMGRIGQLFSLLIYNTAIQHKFTSWIVCLSIHLGQLQIAPWKQNSQEGSRVTHLTGNWSGVCQNQNKCGGKCMITVHFFKKKLFIKNNVIKRILYVKNYIILTFDSVHLGVMLCDIHYGVITANIGHWWRSSTDHPPLGALLILTDKWSKEKVEKLKEKRLCLSKFLRGHNGFSQSSCNSKRGISYVLGSVAWGELLMWPETNIFKVKGKC